MEKTSIKTLIELKHISIIFGISFITLSVLTLMGYLNYVYTHIFFAFGIVWLFFSIDYSILILFKKQEEVEKQNGGHRNTNRKIRNFVQTFDKRQTRVKNLPNVTTKKSRNKIG